MKKKKGRDIPDFSGKPTPPKGKPGDPKSKQVKSTKSQSLEKPRTGSSNSGRRGS